MNCLCFYCHSDNLKQNRVWCLKHLWASHSLSFRLSMLSRDWVHTGRRMNINALCSTCANRDEGVCVGVGVVSGRYLTPSLTCVTCLSVTEALRVQRKLDETTRLLHDLQEAQKERLSAKQPPNMICLLAPTEKELELGESLSGCRLLWFFTQEALKHCKANQAHRAALCHLASRMLPTKFSMLV